MKGLAILQPGQRWKAWLLAAAACALILAGGVLIGFASGRGKAHHQGSKQQLNATQLPPPNSAAAQQLLADPLAPGWVRELYTYHDDSTLITAEHTAALLQLLQQALADSPAAATAAAATSKNSSPAAAATPTAQQLQPFITAAADVLSYLRTHNSRALLPLLRTFSRNGVNGLAAVTLQPELLHYELQQLLRPQALQQWYLDAAASRVGAAGSLVADGTQQQQQQKVTGFLVVPRHSRRRLQSDVGSAADLTSTLLSKMGLGAPAATATTASLAPSLPEAGSPPVSTPKPADLAAAAVAAAPPPTAAAPPPAAPAAAPTASSEGAAAATPPWLSSTALTMATGAAAASDTEPVAAAPATVKTASVATAAAAPRDVAAAAVPAPSTVGAVAHGDSEYSDLEADTQQDMGDTDLLGGEEAGAYTAKEEDEEVLGVEGEGEGEAPTGDDDAWSSPRRDSKGGGSSSDRMAYSSAGRAPTAAGVGSGGVWKSSLSSSSGTGSRRRSSSSSSRGDAAEAGGRHATAWTAAVQQAGHSTGGTAAAAAVCAIQQFSPAGLQRIVDAVLCAAPAPSAYPPTGAWVRQQLTIPVIFHCLRFTRAVTSSSQVLLPPSWGQLDRAASNILSQANKVFHNTGIQFKLQEVRQDPVTHPYLLQANHQAWQRCTHNTASAAASAAGEACLRDLASAQQLAAPFAVHVVVSGSRDELCDPTGAAVRGNSMCNSILPGGYGSSWVWLSWDTFSPATANAPRFADRGASTLASQLAQYLGARPAAAADTEAGSASEDATGDASEAAQCVNTRQQQLPNLAAWCSKFRLGQQPTTLQQLSAATECPGSAFNVLEPSVPDTCALAFTHGQVASMQAAVALSSPQLRATWAQ